MCRVTITLHLTKFIANIVSKIGCLSIERRFLSTKWPIWISLQLIAIFSNAPKERIVCVVTYQVSAWVLFRCNDKYLDLRIYFTSILLHPFGDERFSGNFEVISRRCFCVFKSCGTSNAALRRASNPSAKLAENSYLKCSAEFYGHFFLDGKIFLSNGDKF